MPAPLNRQSPPCLKVVRFPNPRFSNIFRGSGISHSHCPRGGAPTRSISDRVRTDTYHTVHCTAGHCTYGYSLHNGAWAYVFSLSSLLRVGRVESPGAPGGTRWGTWLRAGSVTRGSTCRPALPDPIVKSSSIGTLSATPHLTGYRNGHILPVWPVKCSGPMGSRQGGNK